MFQVLKWWKAGNAGSAALNNGFVVLESKEPVPVLVVVNPQELKMDFGGKEENKN